MSQQALRQAGLRATLPRLKILEIFERSEQRHMSAETVYRALLDADEEVGLATVYRVLTQFEGAGLLKRLHFEGGNALFELDSRSHHDHIVCIRCGRVDEFIDETIEKRQQTIAKRHGYSVTDHSLSIYGICAACQNTSTTEFAHSGEEASPD